MRYDCPFSSATFDASDASVEHVTCLHGQGNTGVELLSFSIAEVSLIRCVASLPPAPMADDDYCVVCAEPLEWVAYGRCGHKDACSKCVSRLRFVMKDTRCLICQQQDSPFVVTRSLGAYTPVMPPDDFDKLQVNRSCAYHYKAPRACPFCPLQLAGDEPGLHSPLQWGYCGLPFLAHYPMAQGEAIRHVCEELLSFASCSVPWTECIRLACGCRAGEGQGWRALPSSVRQCLF